MTRAEFKTKFWVLDAGVQYWYSYFIQGLRNEIHCHCRKDQRTYQRRYCSALSRIAKLKDQYPEYLPNIMFNEVNDLYEIHDDMKYVIYNYKDSIRFGRLNETGEYWVDMWSFNPKYAKFDGRILDNIRNVTLLSECLSKEQAKEQFPEYFI
jgi:hypothetical protein